jgi:cell division protein FtsB
MKVPLTPGRERRLRQHYARTESVSHRAAKAERARWERRVALLKADRLDPDMLDERARQLLDYADPRDVTVLISHRDWPASGRKRAPLIGR